MKTALRLLTLLFLAASAHAQNDLSQTNSFRGFTVGQKIYIDAGTICIGSGTLCGITTNDLFIASKQGVVEVAKTNVDYIHAGAAVVGSGYCSPFTGTRSAVLEFPLGSGTPAQLAAEEELEQAISQGKPVPGSLAITGNGSIIAMGGGSAAQKEAQALQTQAKANQAALTKAAQAQNQLPAITPAEQQAIIADAFSGTMPTPQQVNPANFVNQMPQAQAQAAPAQAGVTEASQGQPGQVKGTQIQAAQMQAAQQVFSAPKASSGKR